MQSKLRGRCACKHLSYEVNGDILMVAHCHCRDCQRSSGAGSATVFAVNRDKCRILGDSSSYVYIGDSGGKVTRHFCPQCGAPLFTEAEALPDWIFLRAVSLDDPGLVHPTMHIYCDSAQPWDIPSDQLPRFGKMPA